MTFKEGQAIQKVWAFLKKNYSMIYIASQTNISPFTRVVSSSIYEDYVVTVDLIWEEDFFFSLSLLNVCTVVSAISSVGSPGPGYSVTNSWTIKLKGNNIRCKISTLALSFMVTVGASVREYSNGLPRKRL